MTSEQNHTKDEKTWCVFENVEIVPEAYIHTVPSFDFGKALGEKYPLLRLIFGYLSYDDLQSCAEVNDLWNTYAAEEIKARTLTTPGWLSFVDLKENEYRLEYNTNHNIAFGLLFCEKFFHQVKTVCLHKGENFQKLDALEFVSKKLVGENIPFILSYGLNVEACLNVNPIMMAGLLIPKLRNVVVERIWGWTDQHIIESVDELIFQKNLEVRALFVFDRYCRGPQGDFLSHILTKQKQKPYALGGGIIRYSNTDLTIHPEPKRKGRKITRVKLNCLAIATPPFSTNFQAYSAFCTSKDDHDGFFERIKGRMILKKHTVIVVCVCIRIVDDVDWLELVEEHFPDTPITCLAVEGEYVWEKLEDPELPDYEDLCMQSYTCALCILTWD